MYERNAWHGLLDYRTLVPPEREGAPPGRLSHGRRLGPFERPRDAMVALEREATFLKVSMPGSRGGAMDGAAHCAPRGRNR